MYYLVLKLVIVFSTLMDIFISAQTSKCYMYIFFNFNFFSLKLSYQNFVVVNNVF